MEAVRAEIIEGLRKMLRIGLDLDSEDERARQAVLVYSWVEVCSSDWDSTDEGQDNWVGGSEAG